MRQSLLAAVMAAGWVMSSAFAVQAQSVRTQVVEFPSHAAGLTCEATRQGLICRLSFTEAIPFGGGFDLKLVAVESGQWQPPQLKLGGLLRMKEGWEDPAKPAALKSGDVLSFEWNFTIDATAAEKLFEREMQPITDAVEKLADEKNLNGAVRTRFVEAQVKKHAADRAETMLKGRDLLQLEALHAWKTRRAGELFLAEKKLERAERETLIMALISESPERVEEALRDLPDVRTELQQIEDDKARSRRLREKADQTFDAVRGRRAAIGWPAPAFLLSVRDGAQKLHRICEWQAAELLFLQTQLDIKSHQSTKWLALHAEVQNYLLTGERAAEGTRLLRDSDIDQLRRASTASVDVAFLPWVANEVPDIGWASAHRVALKPGVVGSIAWKGHTGAKSLPYSAWLEVDAPSGLLCDLVTSEKDLTWCVAKAGDRRFLRIAPRKLGAQVGFEARIRHPQLTGPEVRWEQPASTGTVSFPF